MTHPGDDGRTEEADLGRGLRAAGRRARPAEDVERSVRAAVYAEWQCTVAMRRARRRRRVGYAAVAALGVMGVGAWLSSTRLTAPGAPIASIERVDGEVRYAAGPLPLWRVAGERLALTVGDELRTGDGGRVALALDNGLSVRLDHGTRVELAAEDRIVVRQGAVYIDSGAEEAGAESSLAIDTPAGTVRHLGTQYEVRLLEPGVRVRVREGRVVLERPSDGVLRARAGEQLTVSPDGTVERAAVPVHGDAWQWAVAIAPAFEIDGRPLAQFLAWASRELGREIAYATPEAQAAATRIILSGSVAGLAPEEALNAVLATTGLRRADEDGRIVIDLRTDTN